MTERRWRIAVGVVLAVALAGLVAFPILELVRSLFEESPSSIGDVVRSAPLREAVTNTIVIALAAMILAVTLATGAALVIERSPARRSRWLRAGVLLPLLIPPFVSALSWVTAYGPGGLLDDLVGLTLPGLFGFAGIVVVVTVNAVPLAYLVVAAAIATRADADLEAAARNAGATPFVVLRTITLPAIRPALIGAAALVFVLAINAFGIPAVLGTPAGLSTVTTRIYQDLVFSADPAAFTRVVALAALLAALTLLVVGGADFTTGNRRRPRHRVESPSAVPRVAGRTERMIAIAIGCYVVLSAAIPLTGLVLMSLTKAVGLSPSPENWTTANYAEAFSAGTWRALGTSATLAGLAAVGVVTLSALLVAIERRRPMSPLGTVAALTFAIPGSALGVAMLLAYGPWLRDTLLIILIAYLAKFWALGHRPLAGAVGSLSPDLVRAARSAGASRATALRTVTAPLLGPAVIAAAALVLLFALHELTMSSLLYGPDSTTLAVVTLNLQQLGDPTVTSALAVALTVIAALAAVPLLWAWRAWIRVR